MLVVPLLAALAALALVLLLFLKQRYSYWSSRKVPVLSPIAPFGNFSSCILGRQAISDRIQELYHHFKGEPYVGVYFAHHPLLLVKDLHILKHVFTSDFHDFNSRGVHSDPEYDPLSGNLFNASGTVWRNLRVKLSPAFSTGKLKYMFERVQECAENMRTTLLSRVGAEGGGGSAVVDVKEMVACLTTDFIASMVFGLQSDSIRDPDSQFRRIGRKPFEPSFGQAIRLLFSFFAPDLMKVFRLKFMLPDVNDFFLRLVRETVAYREEHGVQRADLMDLLLQLKNKGFVPSDSPGDMDREQDKRPEHNIQKLTVDEVAAQGMIFFLAGFETTSTTASLALYLLSKHPEAMRRVVEEVDAIMAKNDGALTYEGVMQTKYLEQVLNETLRLYPVIVFLTRQSVRDVRLPGTDLLLEKGTTIMIPTDAIQKDPEYWPDPLRFDPDRFRDENKKAIPQMAFLPFGEGPRTCIGQRLGILQAKVAIMTMLYNFTVSPCSSTPSELKIDPRLITFTPVGGMDFRLSRRTATHSQARQRRD